MSDHEEFESVVLTTDSEGTEMLVDLSGAVLMEGMMVAEVVNAENVRAVLAIFKGRVVREDGQGELKLLLSNSAIGNVLTGLTATVMRMDQPDRLEVAKAIQEAKRSLNIDGL